MDVKGLLLGLVPTAVMMIGIGIFVFVVWIARKRIWKPRRKSPFTHDLLRETGQSLREKLEEQRLDLIIHMMSAMLLPVLMIAIFSFQAAFTGEMIPKFNLILMVSTVFWDGFGLVSRYIEGLKGYRIFAWVMKVSSVSVKHSIGLC